MPTLLVFAGAASHVTRYFQANVAYMLMKKTPPSIPVKTTKKRNCSRPFCDALWCKNGGTCRMVDKKIQCFCLPGFMGERCEEKATCDSKIPKFPPKREGSCVDTFSCNCFGFRSDGDCQVSPMLDVEVKKIIRPIIFVGPINVQFMS